MNMKRPGLLVGIIVAIAALLAIPASAEELCIACHYKQTPNIVKDWEKSKHGDYGVTCYVCHKAGDDEYGEDHHGYRITPVVSPKKCAQCHEYEYETFSKSKHAFAAINGPLMPWYKAMTSQGLNPLDPNTARQNPPRDYIRDKVTPLYPASGIFAKTGLLDEINHENQVLGCMECHGSYVYYDGEKLQGWPNIGIGRINPDGSLGSCASCHTQHQFSIKEARMPETCGKCHLGYDHPQIEIYESSHHGARYMADEENWNWEAKPWKVGVDFSSPTCSVCHMGGIADSSGKVIVQSTHDVGAMLKWEIQGPFNTYQSSNPNKAVGYTPDEKLANENRERMKKICQACHSPNWVDGYFESYEKVLADYDKTAKYAKDLLQRIYDEGLADPSNPIDEFPEMMWYYIWHHEGRRWRMGASMMGPDYTHWMGAVDTVMDKLGRMIDWYETQKRIRGEVPALSTAPDSSTAPLTPPANNAVVAQGVADATTSQTISLPKNVRFVELTAGSFAVLAALALAGRLRGSA
ncbi:Seven times multi-heme cytochrome CxxCH [Geoglobus ahangari]|uniref:Seven times multi-heme cytochrome CxxCH n=2 Tax=Geoglobus ahangari TaxID=113653 RepID=A0A0F7DBN5_9EURY|nr:Seven times multi-heme cytochrome CxxCH [Geoglobus ahangari]